MTLKWTRKDRPDLRSLDYTTPLPAPYHLSDAEIATHILRWYNRQEASYVTSYADADGWQVGSSFYDGNRADADASAQMLYRQAAEAAAAETDGAHDWTDVDVKAAIDHASAALANHNRTTEAAIDNFVYESTAAAEPWNDADGAARVAAAAAAVTVTREDAMNRTTSELLDALDSADGVLGVLDEITAAAAKPKRSHHKARITSAPAKFTELPDVAAVATDAGQVDLDAAAKAAAEARKAAQNEARKAAAKAAVEAAAAKAAKEKADAAARTAGPVEIFKPAGAATAKATPAPKPSAKPAAKPAAKPKAAKEPRFRGAKVDTSKTVETKAGLAYVILAANGSPARDEYQGQNWVWSCPTCNRRTRDELCTGTAAKGGPIHDAVKAPANFRLADRLVPVKKGR